MAVKARVKVLGSPLDGPVRGLPGIGPRLAERLAKLAIERVRDLLFHLPLRYEDRTRVTPIGALRADSRALLVAEVGAAQVKLGRRRSLLVRVSDGTGQIDLRFFHFGATQREGFKRGAKVCCWGTARRGYAGLEVVHPEYQLLGDGETPPLEDRLSPVYPMTDGITQVQLRRLTGLALRLAREDDGGLDDWLGERVAPLGLPHLLDALELVHAPPASEDTAALVEGRHPAVRRLALEELVAHHLSHQAVRKAMDARQAPALSRDAGLCERFVSSLDFSLTDAQARVLAEIEADLGRARPMYRLVQGDVGSGKTVVAALAILNAIGRGHQAAVMAPTELLAEQHLRSFYDWFEPLGIRVVWLGGRQGARARRDALEALACGQAQVAVGTHALFQDEVRFASLVLAVIDEQHRFGVHQRLSLLSKGSGPQVTPHQLIMTATPIPRTLAMTTCAHLDISSIDELPKGRQPIDTAVLADTRRDELVERVAKACAAGQQAYWVCPLIDDSEAIEAQAAEETASALAQGLPDLRIGLVHGRKKGAERDAVMGAFRDGDIDLLVATTVIEVGVDVPNASLMVIENAERMGLAQLHQLRGRVGRGSRKSACVLLYRTPLSRMARARLAAMRETTDGFVIAAKDLELRGPGEVLGTRQTGELTLRIAELGRDHALVEDAVEIAASLPEQAGPALVTRWVGDAVDYGEVG